MAYVGATLRLESLSGLMIVVAMALGLAAKNSPIAHLYDVVHHATVHIGIGAWVSDEPLIFWINEGLMVFFFLLVGLELKRELLEGYLSTLRQALLPAYAAAGGMAVPALVYVGFTWADPVSVRGWAIPTATDIVLALGILMLLGRRVPAALKVFLTALAIFDDIGAVLIIGIFYGKALFVLPLVAAAIALGGLWLLNKYAVTAAWPYIVGGGTLWLAMVNSGFEATLAGVLIGFAVPMRVSPNADRSPLERVEAEIHPWVALVVVPLFAFFNAGVAVDARVFANLGTPVSLGIVFGLFFGKQLGIMAATWAAARLGAARLPDGVTWSQIYGAAAVAGIGFTMSLFVTTLAFTDPETIANAKLAVLAASALSAAVGLFILYAATKHATTLSPRRESAVKGR